MISCERTWTLFHPHRYIIRPTYCSGDVISELQLDLGIHETM